MTSPGDLSPGERLQFQGRPPVPVKNGYHFFFIEKEGVEYWLSQTWEAGYYYSQWIYTKEGKTGHVSRKVHNKNSLEVNVKSRDQDLIKPLTRQGIATREEVEGYLENLGIFLTLHPELSEKPAPPENKPKKEEDDEERPPENFQDYPEDIQKAALHIINSKNPLQVLKAGVGEVHIGDDPEVEFSILKEFTPHVGNADPVHSRIAGGTDTGKTDLAKHTLKIVPARYQQDITTLSSKALHYDDTLREDFNHIVINDFLDSPDALGLIKVMTDNLAEKKEHKTVIDNQGVTLEIPGRNTVTITAAKDINDPETERRFLQLNPQEDEEHTREVKEFIRRSGVTGTVDQGTVFQICQAVFDKLTSRSLEVFNPWIDCIDIEDKGFTDIKIFISLVKARGLIFQEHRHRIDEDTILGSREDVEEVARLWVKIAPLQQFKLNKKQVELLKTLPVFDPEVYNASLRSMKDEGVYTLEGVTGRTYKELGEKFKVSRGTLRNWIKGYEDRKTQTFKPGLSDLGFIITRSSNPDNEKAPILLYLSEEKKEYVEGLKDNATLVNHVHYQIDIGFSGLDGRKKIVDLFLSYVKKIEKQRDQKNFAPYLKDTHREVKTDEDVYRIIQLTQKALKELPGVESDQVEKILHTLTHPKNYHTPKREEKTPRDKPTPGTLLKKEFANIDKGEQPKEDSSQGYSKTFEEIQVEKEVLNYLEEHPDRADFNIISRQVTEDTGIDEPLVKKIIKGLISGGALKDRGDGNLEAVER